MWSLVFTSALAAPPQMWTATAAGAGLGLGLGGVPLMVELASTGDVSPVGVGLGGAGLVAGSVIGVHAVCRGQAGLELGGAAVGAVAGAGVAALGAAGALAVTLPYLEAHAMPNGPRAIAFTAAGLGAIALVTAPALGAATADQIQPGARVSVAPTLLRGDDGMVAGIAIGRTLGGARHADPG